MPSKVGWSSPPQRRFELFVEERLRQADLVVVGPKRGCHGTRVGGLVEAGLVEGDVESAHLAAAGLHSERCNGAGVDAA